MKEHLNTSIQIIKSTNSIAKSLPSLLPAFDGGSMYLHAVTTRAFINAIHLDRTMQMEVIETEGRLDTTAIVYMYGRQALIDLHLGKST